MFQFHSGLIKSLIKIFIDTRIKLVSIPFWSD